MKRFLDLADLASEEIRGLLADRGITVMGGNSNTLSIAATPDVFETLFGMDPAAAADSGTAAHATRLPPELEPFVADVFVPPGPTFFP